MTKAIDYFSYNNPLIPLKTYFSLRARKKMYQKFKKYCQPNEVDEVLDLGATPDTTLADSNFFEKLYPYKHKITVASIEDCSFMVDKYGLKAYVKNYPHEALPFKDKQFDILFCSAVLEHVGTRKNQKFFLKECMRISKKIFITTPNRYFPLEMHTFLPFLHWLPWGTFQKILKLLKKDFWADINNLNLLSKRDIHVMFNQDILDVSYVKTMGLNSNLIIMRHRV